MISRHFQTEHDKLPPAQPRLFFWRQRAFTKDRGRCFFFGGGGVYDFFLDPRGIQYIRGTSSVHDAKNERPCTAPVPCAVRKTPKTWYPLSQSGLTVALGFSTYIICVCSTSAHRTSAPFVFISAPGVATARK
jgi:hypothetical protein